MHLEETLQLSLDEKEDIIKALQTQVQENSIFKFQLPHYFKSSGETKISSK